MKVFSAQQLSKIDQLTCEKQGISELQLMERAAIRLMETLLQKYPKKQYCILAGLGNNGGDGYALARLLQDKGEQVKLISAQANKQLSSAAATNFHAYSGEALLLNKEQDFKEIEKWLSADSLLIDCLFGTGLNRPLEGFFKNLVQFINELQLPVVSIDVPSGLASELPLPDKFEAIISQDCFTIHCPKASFFYEAAWPYVQQFTIVDIGLQESLLQEKEQFQYMNASWINEIRKPRHPFSHKGNFGHVWLWAGSGNMPGAGILAAMACLKVGAGKLSVQFPEEHQAALISQLPEAMLMPKALNEFNGISDLLNSFTAFGLGPGIGNTTSAKAYLKWIIQMVKQPLVLDADALNMLAEEKTWLSFLPKHSILCPHPGEFDRLLGKSFSGSYERELAAVQFAKANQVCIVLKGRFTALISPNGDVFKNATGNPALAKAGTGDVLMGMITGFLAQSYSPMQAACLAVYYLSLIHISEPTRPY